MGAFTAVDQLWYPDVTDIDQPNVWAAHMMQSISDGMGKRLAQQELAIGLKGGLASVVTLSTTYAIMPIVINAANGNFAQGLTISGGIVTVVTPGMYYISGALGIFNSSGHSSKIQLRKNGSAIVGDEQASQAAYYQASKASTVVNCVAGDTLAMYGADGVGGTTTSTATELTHFTVALIQALPL